MLLHFSLLFRMNLGHFSSTLSRKVHATNYIGRYEWRQFLAVHFTHSLSGTEQNFLIVNRSVSSASCILSSFKMEWAKEKMKENQLMLAHAMYMHNDFSNWLCHSQHSYCSLIHCLKIENSSNPIHPTIWHRWCWFFIMCNI